ncbi:uncharacterized protein STEHIDRAFT_115359 [Stereum hirsutum FP-91666 SS1]|uniref:uncharacterized protein n=1 Tax=Stereum hirsutum (strain FP-91666) TaxID=721885 RepID=UPI000444A89D|nr:uncharacterized protein STEHIDRAFT_115359 [Stereum hirsutum FP-91666 SS1]EIM81230.1 hypothetical protein STEHIDRAFT_115359 [Stereum hirsutum FP-91666 SS1]
MKPVMTSETKDFQHPFASNGIRTSPFICFVEKSASPSFVEVYEEAFNKIRHNEMASNVCLPPHYPNEVGVVVPLVVQTLAYGFYGCLVIPALYLLYYWTTSFVMSMNALKKDWPNESFTEGEFEGSQDRLLASLDYMTLLILTCNDTVVVWRACVVSSLRARKWILTVVFLTFVLAIQFALASTALNISWTTTSIVQSDHRLGHRRNPLSTHLLEVAYGLPLLTNIWPTCIIAQKMWSHLRDSNAARLSEQRPTTMIRNVLVLLVESGLLFSSLVFTRFHGRAFTSQSTGGMLWSM